MSLNLRPLLSFRFLLLLSFVCSAVEASLVFGSGDIVEIRCVSFLNRVCGLPLAVVHRENDDTFWFDSTATTTR